MNKKWLARFKEDQSGTATIESLLWIPLFFYIFVLITDASFIFFGKAQALRIIQDGNRAYSVDAFETSEEASAYIQSQLRAFAPQATVTTNVSNGIIVTNATLRSGDLMAVGSIPGIKNIDIQITAQHFQEK